MRKGISLKRIFVIIGVGLLLPSMNNYTKIKMIVSTSVANLRFQPVRIDGSTRAPALPKDLKLQNSQVLFCEGVLAEPLEENPD